MATVFKKISESLELEIKKQKKSLDIAYGKYKSYDIVLMEMVRDQVFFLSMPVNADDQLKNQKLEFFLEGIKKDNKKLNKLTYEDHAIKMEFRMGLGVKGSIEKVKGILDDIVEHLKFNGYYSSCESCGEKKDTSLVILNGKPSYYCEDCIKGKEEFLRDKLDGEIDKKSLTGKSILAAIVGGLIGMLIWIPLELFISVGAWFGVATMVFGTTKGFRKYNDKWSKKAMFILVLIMILISILGVYAIYSASIYLALIETGPISFMEVFTTAFWLILLDIEFTAAFIGQLFGTLIILLIMTSFMFTAISKEYKDEREIKRVL